jgi:hypothetical protein
MPKLLPHAQPEESILIAVGSVFVQGTGLVPSPPVVASPLLPLLLPPSETPELFDRPPDPLLEELPLPLPELEWPVPLLLGPTPLLLGEEPLPLPLLAPLLAPEPPDEPPPSSPVSLPDEPQASIGNKPGATASPTMRRTKR